MRGGKPIWLRCALWAAFPGTKGDVAVTEEAEEDRQREDDGARDVGRAVIASGLAADDHYHKRQRGSGQHHAAGIDVGSSRVDLQACKLEYSIVSPK